MYCKQLKNMPVIATEWQMYAACPGCEWYEDGKCSDPRRTNYDSPCEFEVNGTKLKLNLISVTPIRIEDSVTVPHI